MKTKLTLNKSLYDKLTEDRELFEYKSENDFFRTILINTYYYDNQINKIESIKKKLIDSTNYYKNNDIIQSIIQHMSDEDFNKQLTELAILLSSKENIASTLVNEKKCVYIRDNKKQELEKIYKETSTMKAAPLYTELLSTYISYPLYIREKIIYKDIFEELMQIKEKKEACVIKTTKSEFEFDLYDIVIGKEEFHYYIVGYEKTKGRKTRCFKLSTVKKVFRSLKTFSISTEEIVQIKEKLSKGPEWINGEFVEDCRVEFDENGLRKYKELLQGRPKGKFINDSKTIMSFSCNRTQLFNYLKLFGSHAVVLNNKSLIKSLNTHYSKAKDTYSEQNNKKDLNVEE